MAFDHLLILIQLEQEDRKPPFLFEFNKYWLDKEYFRLLITKNGKFMILFMRFSYASICLQLASVCLNMHFYNELVNSLGLLTFLPN